MSWQGDVYTWLLQAPGERWMRLGELFERVSLKIPLHYAMRHVVRHSPDGALADSNEHAQWLYFKEMLHYMNLERRGGRSRRWKYGDEVRLRWIDGRTCPDCGGPVVQAGWSAKTGIRCASSCGQSRASVGTTLDDLVRAMKKIYFTRALYLNLIRFKATHVSATKPLSRHCNA